MVKTMTMTMRKTMKLTEKQITTIMKNSFGWGDAKRKLFVALGVEYQWDAQLPEYVLQTIKQYRNG